ncbi:O-antigen ligase family protein [Roseovarius sp.]|uniref:O-antigen ligase family protein n=1 Tax=Roseovarius sp. TaxID=1486281 RepID=UPI003D0F7007
MVAKAKKGLAEQSRIQGLGNTKKVVGLPAVAATFLIGLFIPLFIFLGPIRMSAYRIVLLLIFLPALVQLLKGLAGRMRLPDFCVIGICVWSSISLIVLHGISQTIEPIGVLWIETLGAYLIGRVYIRTPEAFYAVAKILFSMCLLMLPFVIFEALASKNLILLLFNKIGPSLPDLAAEIDNRLGLNRTQGPFDHPIIFGVLFGSLIGVSYYVLGYGRKIFMRMLQPVLLAVTAALSLSTGPLIAMNVQIFLVFWDKILSSVKARWYILTALAIVGYLIVDIFFANRTPFHTLVAYLSFSQGSAYNRILIWIYGTQNIFDNPVFGIGLEDWARPSWMSSSMDMFWIVGAVKHGVVVWVLWLALFFAVFLQVALKKELNTRVQYYRTGYLISLFGLFMAGWTVHFFNALFVYFMFMLGCGLWITERVADDEADTTSEERERTLSYSRFPPRAVRHTAGRPPSKTLS